MAIRQGCWRLLAALLLAAPASAAEPLRAQLQRADQHYQAGDLVAAAGDLEGAIEALRRELAARYRATLPPPPIGWRAEPASAAATLAMPGGGTRVASTYRDREGASIRVELILDNPMIQAFTVLTRAPALAAPAAGLERFQIDGATALLNWDPAAGSGDLVLPISERVLAKLKGNGLADKAQLVELMADWDLAAVRSMAGD